MILRLKEPWPLAITEMDLENAFRSYATINAYYYYAGILYILD